MVKSVEWVKSYSFPSPSCAVVAEEGAGCAGISWKSGIAGSDSGAAGSTCATFGCDQAGAVVSGIDEIQNSTAAARASATATCVAGDAVGAIAAVASGCGDAAIVEDRVREEQQDAAAAAATTACAAEI